MVIILTPNGWINGFAVTGIIIFGVVFGLFLINEYRKFKIKLLFYLGLAGICGGLIFLGNFLDFLAILITEKNIDNSGGIVGFASNLWWGPAFSLILYFSSELIIPEKKWYILSPFVVMSIILIILLIIDPIGSFEFIYPSISGTDLIEDNPNFETLSGILGVFLMISVIMFAIVGFLYKSLKTEGLIKKKFSILFIGIMAITIFGLSDQFIEPGTILSLMRFGQIGSYLIIYYGIKESSAEPKEKKQKKEIKIEGDIFRLSKTKPSDITEEDITYFKEKKKCLVCKGSAVNFTYICPKCEALYCVNCAQALTGLENQCWGCNTPIDKSKPVKSIKEENIDASIEPEKRK